MQDAPHVSPSQIATWDKCKRKWAYTRVRPRQPNKYADFGTRTHAILEAYLHDGTMPNPREPEGATAIAGLPYLPKPGTARVEQPIEFELGGATYVGFADFVGPAALIGDHKTTGDLKWAKTSGDLETDPQWIVYGYWLTLELGLTADDEVEGLWVYYTRARPHRAKPVRVRSTAGELASAMRDIHDRVGHRLPVLNQGLRDREVCPSDFPRTPDHCHAYGGCPFRDECWADLTRLQRATYAWKRNNTEQGDDDMSQIANLTAQLLARKNGAAPTPTTPAETKPTIDVEATEATEPPADIDPRPPEKKAPKRKAPAKAKAKPKTKAEPAADKTPAPGKIDLQPEPADDYDPRPYERVALLNACAYGGLSPEQAATYLELYEELSR